MKDDVLKTISLWLVGKLLSTKLMNRDVFHSLIAKIWRTTQAIEVENVRENVFAFHFQNTADHQRVFIRGPWNFDNALLVLEAPSGSGDFADMQFRWVDF
ncbi:hypothetical protein ACOSQ2_021714 [Xanthoceras sorbifolium]